MDFYNICTRSSKKGILEVYPDFKVRRSRDLMIRGKAFYAIWDEKNHLWSTDEYDVQRLVDEELYAYKDELEKETSDRIHVKSLGNFSSGAWTEFKNYITKLSDNSHQLDEKITFVNEKIKKTDYVSKFVSYSLEEGEYNSYEKLISTLYSPEERAKLEWAIGSVISGDAKNIQKFIVLYGEAGAGKSTVLNIIQQLFQGYYTTFEAKALTSNSNAFSTEVFKSNPLVAIQHDGDLSHIEDNTKLNSIVSHEEMTMNEKYKSSYMARVNCFLFMATNRPVKITDAKSGIIRRLIDVKPSGNRIPPKEYQALMKQIQFELGAIAYHCLKIYEEMGQDYYSDYIPFDMIFQTDVFFNFVEDNFEVFNSQDGVSLKQAYTMYKTYCDDTLVQFKLPMYKFREELKNYFNNFDEVTRIDSKQVRSYFSGFKKDKFLMKMPEKEKGNFIELTSTTSLLDEILAECPAQYANEKGTPEKKWSEVKTKLKDLDTSKLHYANIEDIHHIVIDFDLKNEKGEKDVKKNLEAASKWPPTYAEFSKGGAGVHLHYIYDGDPLKVKSVYEDGIEIKIFNGKSALRRKLSRCNNLPIAHLSGGLPLKGEKKMLNFDTVQNEKTIRSLIRKNLNKEIHPGTKPSIDFIYKILDDAYNSGVSYDVSDLRPKILAFANNSTHQSDYCVKLVSKMKFKSEEASANLYSYDENELVFFDVEVFPNLFLVNWKYEGDGKECVRMINPTPSEIEMLLKMKLIGFNCRRYDNHILYARYIGYSNKELFDLSQRIINESRNALFGEAYNISYTDVYDFSSKKQSLKKFEIDLGIHHQELGLPWDQPVPEERWTEVAEYCDNDVIATEKVFHARKADWVARQILSMLSGLSVNDTTQHHAAKIIFGNDKNPQDKFIYTNLSEMFPGYKFEYGKSYYRGEETGEGGYVYAEPGMYSNIALLDVASMHPTSIEQLNLFGPYTKNFSDIKSARIAIKHKDYDGIKHVLDGKLVPFYDSALLDNADFTLDDLAYALKIVINIVYGLTSAKFSNPFKDPRNVDNIVAKRGALFMINLKHEVQDRGFKVAHIKTDSIKIPNATDEIINFVMDYGKKYGYTFEHEATYERMCLVNDAVYIAKYDNGLWSATGTQFQVPYVYKKLFSKEPIEFDDMCETKSVTSALYLDMNENLPDSSEYEKEYDKLWKLISDKQKLNKPMKEECDRIEELSKLIDECHNYVFIGKVGRFCPIKPGCGGGLLLREKDGKYYSATGAKGYRWLESEVVKEFKNPNEVIDISYYDSLVESAISEINKYGDFNMFANSEDMPPWI